MIKITFRNGQTLIELVIAIGLAAALLPALVSGVAASRLGKAQQIQRFGAVGLLKEAEEAVRAARNNDWSNVANNGVFHPTVSGNTWILQNNSESINGYQRSITISDVLRNSSGLISSSGTILDPSVKKVDTTISWGTPLVSQVTSTLYLTRYINNDFFIDTTVGDFTKAGSVLTSVQAVSPSGNNSSSDGQVTLSQAGGADWCNPGSPVTQLDLNGSALARSVVAGNDRAYVGTGQNASGKAFYNVSISSTFPPVAAEDGVYDYPQSSSKTNNVFGSGNYAYLATDTNSAEVVILNVTTNTPTLVSVIDTPGSADASSVFVSNNMLFVTTASNDQSASTLLRYDVSNPASPVAKGQIILNGNAKKIYVVGNYVYAAIGSSSNQLQVIDASNATSLSQPSGGNQGLLKVNSKDGVDVFVRSDGLRAYLVTTLSADPDFFIIDVSNPATPIKKGTGYNTGTMNPQGLTVIDNRAIIVGFNNPRYQVVKVDDDNYVQCAAVNEPDDIYAVSSLYANGHAYSYIVTANAGSEFQIIEGGLGGAGGYTTSGTYQSATFGYPNTTTPQQIAFNRADVTVNKPAGTDIQFQVAVADAVGGNCSAVSFTFVGPSGPGSSFSTGAASGTDTTLNLPIPFPTGGWSGYVNPGKCFQYKAIFTTTDTSRTPLLKDVTINYSP